MDTRSRGDFGRTLRTARERRGMSVSQLASATKISVHALEALEQNDFSHLPGGIFSRAFVRSYAIEVGLDPDATVQEFIDQFPRDVITAGNPSRPRGEDHDAIESDRRTAMTFLRLIALSVPIAVAIVYFGATGRESSRKVPAPPPGEPAAATPEITGPGRSNGAPLPVPVDTPAPAPPGSTPVAAPIGTQSSAPLPVAAAVPGSLTVSLSAIRPCQVSIVLDGEPSAGRLMQAGEQETFDVHRDLVLTASDPSALVVTLNGAEARTLGKAGQEVTVRFNASDFKEYLVTR